MRYGSVCSGIEAATVAWHPLGWEPAWYSEIDPFPSAVLSHHYPGVPNLGDMTTLPASILAGDVEAPDVLCGGTPCQAFSVAGLRRSLDDARGNLSLTFVELADAVDAVRRSRGLSPAIIFWENVPGVLSTADNAFGCFLAGVAGEDVPLEPPGGRWTDAGVVLGPTRAVAWRVLDAQYFGLAQRRRRVFVVASARDGFDPAEVLLEWDGVRRDSAPSPEARQGVARGVGGGPEGGSISGAVTRKWAKGSGGPAGDECYNMGAQPVAFYDYLGSQGGGVEVGVSPTLKKKDGVAVTQPVAFHPTQDPISSEDGTTHAMGCGSRGGMATVAVAFAENQRAELTISDTAGSLKVAGGKPGQGYPALLTAAMQVRRLTPRECERLQGFPDDYTLIPWRNKPASECPDGPRYKALGNSWAVPVVRWIGARIANMVQE